MYIICAVVGFAGGVLGSVALMGVLYIVKEGKDENI